MSQKSNPIFPDWVVFHVPHNSRSIPDSVLGQYMLSKTELEMEIEKITDHYTHEIFCDGQCVDRIVVASFSRLVVDVERFVHDENEPMAKRGMGVVYKVTTDLTPLRREISEEERQLLIRNYYEPHHKKLEKVVSSVVNEHGRCFVLDCHSFPDKPLPYEFSPCDGSRPDICIGTDSFHTSKGRRATFVDAFESEGFSVSVDSPFAGALVPTSRYHSDERVEAIMVEVNRRIYLESDTSKRRGDFLAIVSKIRSACLKGLQES